jgi:hypothetical protein
MLDDDRYVKAYDSGYIDGVERVLELMEVYVNRMMVVDEIPLGRACENMLEDIKNTLDSE